MQRGHELLRDRDSLFRFDGYARTSHLSHGSHHRHGFGMLLNLRQIFTRVSCENARDFRAVFRREALGGYR